MTRRHLRALSGGLLLLVLVPSVAWADDCSALTDCWDQILTALLVLAAVVLFVAIAWEILAGGIVIGGLAEEAIAEEAIAAEEALTSEEAIAAERAAAQARLEAIAREVNPLGGEGNCSWTAREIDEALRETFAGRTPQPYAPDWFTAEFSPDSVIRREAFGFAQRASLEAEYGGTFQEVSMRAIADQVQAAGNGARGLICVSEDGVGHLFNVVNYGGEVFFIDGQAAGLGEVGVWTEASLGPTGYSTSAVIRFLLTAG
jgi:hypothetical protein